MTGVPQGLSRGQAERRIPGILEAFGHPDVDGEESGHAGEIVLRGHKEAFAIRGTIDWIISAAAPPHRVGILHNDRDPDAIARVSPLNIC